MGIDNEQSRGINSGAGGQAIIEHVLRDEIPTSDSLPSLTGNEISPLQLCRVLTKDPKTNRLLEVRTRYLGIVDGAVVFVDTDHGRPLVVPKQSIDRRSVAILPEPQLQSTRLNFEPDWEKIAEFWANPPDEKDPFPSW